MSIGLRVWNFGCKVELLKDVCVFAFPTWATLHHLESCFFLYIRILTLSSATCRLCCNGQGTCGWGSNPPQGA
jgi:hypothetical protein